MRYSRLLTVTMFFLGTALTMGLSACGSDNNGHGTTPGTGTQTLEVRAHVEATEAMDNASQATDFEVEFEVTVFRSGAAVDDAVVTITPFGGSPITLDAQGGGSGRYTGSRVGYAQTYSLEVTAGQDNIRGARVNGPDIHTFSHPTVSAVVEPEQPLTVTWNRLGAADEAELETEEFDETNVNDSGSFTVPGTSFPGEQDKQEEDRVTLWRTNRVGLVGGVGSSELSVSLRNRVSFLIDLAP